MLLTPSGQRVALIRVARIRVLGHRSAHLAPGPDLPVSTHRRLPKHRKPRPQRLRRGPARITLVVAAATTAIAGGVSAGVAVAAGPPASPLAGARLHPDSAAAGTRADSAAPGAAAAHAAPQATAAAQATARGATSARPTASTSRRAVASARTSAGTAATARPYLIYDSLAPAALPSGHVVATYATGPGAVSAAQVAGRGPVLWIDVNATDPAADVLDIEPGNATPAAAPGWVYRKLSANPKAVAILYSSISEWPALQAAVASLPAAMRAQIRWWIADPTGYPHVVPGSDATQWYWGSSYDVSTALPRF